MLGYVVFVVCDGVVCFVLVVIGYENMKYIYIDFGLNEGDLVIVDNFVGFCDG